jgi:hypothetical protein
MLGVGMTPPNVLGTPKPASSVMISRMLGAPLGGTTVGGHQGVECRASSLITPPNFGAGGGSWVPGIVVVALGEPSWPVTVTGALAPGCVGWTALHAVRTKTLASSPAGTFEYRIEASLVRVHLHELHATIIDSARPSVSDPSTLPVVQRDPGVLVEARLPSAGEHPDHDADERRDPDQQKDYRSHVQPLTMEIPAVHAVASPSAEMRGRAAHR